MLEAPGLDDGRLGELLEELELDGSEGRLLLEELELDGEGMDGILALELLWLLLWQAASNTVLTPPASNRRANRLMELDGPGLFMSNSLYLKLMYGCENGQFKPASYPIASHFAAVRGIYPHFAAFYQENRNAKSKSARIIWFREDPFSFSEYRSICPVVNDLLSRKPLIYRSILTRFHAAPRYPIDTLDFITDSDCLSLNPALSPQCDRTCVPCHLAPGFSFCFCSCFCVSCHFGDRWRR